MNDLPNMTLYLLFGFGLAVTGAVTAAYYMALKYTPIEDRADVAKVVIPLVTIGVIVAAVYALAVVGRMGENSVAALFGALAGYVLGKASPRVLSGKGKKGSKTEKAGDEQHH